MSNPTHDYHNPSLSVEQRVADLLGHMTLEEKVGQLIMWDARSDDLSFITTHHAGSILHILGEKLNRAMDLAGAADSESRYWLARMPFTGTPSGKGPPSSRLNWPWLPVGIPTCSKKSAG
jgi:hypothetical protein